MKYRQPLALLWIGAVAFTGCGQSEAAQADTAAPTVATTTVVTTNATVSPSSQPSTTDSTATKTSTTESSTTEKSTVPDQSTAPPPETTPCSADDDPKSGKTYTVTGVEADDVLNIRAFPGHTTAKIGALGPNTAGLRPTGGCAKVGVAVWWELNVGDGAWINAKFLTPAT